jgi:cyclase
LKLSGSSSCAGVKSMSPYPLIFARKSDAALAASVFHYGEMSVADVKDFLDQKGIPVRR